MKKSTNWMNNPAFVPDNTVNKLILLCVMDKMEMPLTEDSIISICTNQNTWLKYMECKDILWQLVDIGYIAKTQVDDENRYNITHEGRNCLSNFYSKIPITTREEITGFTKENKINLKRSQEYVGTYFKNQDETYTSYLKIRNPLETQNLFEIKIVYPSRSQAIKATKKWKEKAASIFENVYETLYDEEN